ncbi:MAG: transcription termination factor NusA [Proteobacteria bacterium]|nr:transcription termination factor NusA [Desulfobulbaceae bacterium]MBU4151911.1 transcription termination factor NusA [Pseudomonadota bacterium]
MISDLKRVIDQVCRDKGINRDLLIKGLEEAVMSAAKKKFGMRREMEAQYNDETGEVELYQFRTVVETVEDEQTQISLAEAQVLDPDVELTDDLGSKMENVSELGRIAAQSAKQVIIQKMKDAEREVVYEMFKDRKGDVVNGIVQRFERGHIIVNLGRTDAILPRNEQMPRRSYHQGDRIRALLMDIRQDARDSQLILSRTDKQFVAKLFAIEVPEIAEGIVTILAVAREPGVRAKIAVSSSENDVDPVGACVGMKGSRVQNVVQELQGERIDIVPWSPDPAKFVSNALAPAEVSMVVVDEERRTLQVVVADDQLSLAIGRGGQNVRLASELMGWRIDVKSEQKYQKLMEEGFQSLIAIKGINHPMADILYDNDITSAAELAEADPAALSGMLEGVSEEVCANLIAAARAVPVPKNEDEGVVEAEVLPATEQPS